MIPRSRIQAEQSVATYTRRKARRFMFARLGNNAGTVEIGTGNRVYVRLHGDGNQVTRALNSNSIQLVANLPVIVEEIRQGGSVRYEVIARASEWYSDDPYANTVGNHGWQHERKDFNLGGPDPVEVWTRARPELRGQENSPAAMNIWINTGKYMMSNVEVTWLGGNSPVITAPVVAGTERCDLIYLNAANVASVQAGTATPYNPFVRAAKPTPPTAGYFPVAWIWTKNGQTTIEEEDIADARLPFGSAGSGSVAAHNIFSATHSDTLADTVVRGDIAYVNATPKLARLAKGAAFAVLTGDGTDTAWSSYLLSGTAGGKTNFAVTNAKTLTLTATDDFNLTIPATGTAALLGIANNFSAINTFSNATDASSSITGGVIISGGLGVAKKLYVGTTLNVGGRVQAASFGAGGQVSTTAGNLYLSPFTGVVSLFDGASAMQIQMYNANTLTFLFNASGNSYINNAGNLGLGTNLPTQKLSFGGNEARTIWLERHTTANTAGNSLNVQSGGATAGATDKDGGAFIQAPGLSTGTGKSSIRQQRLTRASASGTADNSLVDAVVIPSVVMLTSESTASLFEVALPAGGMCGGMILFTITATDGTELQVHTGHSHFAANNKGGVYTTQIVDEPITDDANANSAGTITDTWGITTGVNKITITVAVACSSIAANDIRIYYTIYNNSGQAVTQL